MYKSLLNTVRVPIYKKPGSRGPFFFLDRSHFLHQIPGQEHGDGHHGNTSCAHGHCRREIGHREVILFVVQLLMRMPLELQDLDVEAKTDFRLRRVLAPHQMARGLAALQAPFRIVH